MEKDVPHEAVHCLGEFCARVDVLARGPEGDLTTSAARNSALISCSLDSKVTNHTVSSSVSGSSKVSVWTGEFVFTIRTKSSFMR